MIESSPVLRRLAPLLPLPFLVALAAWGSARLADHAGARLAHVLVVVAQLLASEENRNTPRVEDDLDDLGLLDDLRDLDVAPLIRVTASGATTPAPSKTRKRAPLAKPGPAAHGVFISAETVLKLANSRVRPRGVAVPAEGKRPAGLRLSRVAALGIGLRDGDVLTRAVGQPALSSGAVVQAVLIARARRAAVLDGEFWRDGERWSLRVEQPYPKAP